MNNITMALNADELILSALREDITSEDITKGLIDLMGGSIQAESQVGKIGRASCRERVFRAV